MVNKNVYNTHYKLKKINSELYKRYRFNSIVILKDVIKKLVKGVEIDETRLETIINISNVNEERLKDLITYYPVNLREKKYITDDVVNELSLKYQTTLEIMLSHEKYINIRHVLWRSAMGRAKTLHLNKISGDLIKQEDIILPHKCPLTEIPLNYHNTKMSFNSPSLDRIDNTKNYLVDNIQVISILGNSMKSSATPEELIIFANNMLKIYT